MQRWKAAGVVCPSWYMLDHEAPAEFKQAICENDCCVELIPQDVHHCNAAEHAIQEYMRKVVLAGVSSDFLVHQWDELIPQIRLH